MEQTVFALVTNEDARDSRDLFNQLIRELSAGTPWFDRAIEE